MTARTLPGRVVDRDHQGWMLVGHPDGGDAYTVNHVDGYLTPDELAEQHGPLRPVEPITAEDRAELERLLALAGRKAVYSLAVAVYRTIHRFRDDAGGYDPDNYDLNRRTHETSMRQVKAGRPGSWEAAQLVEVALWAGTGKSSRIHEDACAGMTDVLYRWGTDPTRFTEVAETLAAAVSEYADEHGGWAAVADQWLQPGGLDQEGVRLTYGLFYSLGKDFDYSALG